MGKFKELDIERINEMKAKGGTVDLSTWIWSAPAPSDGTIYFGNYCFIPDLKPKQVIFNPPCTTVLWNDGSKTIVKCFNEEFDPEKGFSMAIAKKILGRMEFERLMNVGLECFNNKQKKLAKLEE